MKINMGKLLSGIVKAVKNNPEIALMVVGAIAPKASAKLTKVISSAR